MRQLPEESLGYKWLTQRLMKCQEVDLVWAIPHPFLTFPAYIDNDNISPQKCVIYKYSHVSVSVVPTILTRSNHAKKDSFFHLLDKYLFWGVWLRCEGLVSSLQKLSTASVPGLGLVLVKFRRFFWPKKFFLNNISNSSSCSWAGEVNTRNSPSFLHNELEDKFPVLFNL